MNDLFREIMSSVLINWKVKNHPYLTSLLKGFYIAILMFVSITITRTLISGFAVYKVESDLKGSIIFGCIISIVLVFLTLAKKILKY